MLDEQNDEAAEELLLGAVDDDDGSSEGFVIEEEAAEGSVEDSAMRTGSFSVQARQMLDRLYAADGPEEG